MEKKYGRAIDGIENHMIVSGTLFSEKLCDARINDEANGIYVSENWIINKIKEINGWKRLTKNRRDILLIEAYYLGREERRPKAGVLPIYAYMPRE